MSDEVRRLDPRIDRTRVAVLSAVRELLNEAGWEAVTHVRVAERSGTGRTTIYRHWPERIDLVREAYEFELDVLRDLEITGDLRTDLTTALAAIRYELIDREGTHILAALISQSEFDESVRQVKKVLVDYSLQVLRQVMSQAIAAGQLEPGVTVEGSISELVGPMLMHRMVQDSYVGPERVPELVTAFLTAHAPGVR